MTEKGGEPGGLVPAPGGNVYQVKDFHVDGSHLTLTLSAATASRPALTWDLQPAAGSSPACRRAATPPRQSTACVHAGAEAQGAQSLDGSGAALQRQGPDGLGADRHPAASHWKVEDGLLVNTAHGANLKTTRKFEDFKVHYEVNCPDDGNSGFYLRGRYEVQIEYEPLTSNPPERRIGSVYGRIAPQPALPRTPGQWETFDVTLVGRIVTEVHNGVTVIDHKEIEGITGGALDANEGEPGPFYIQGDHTGGLKFRNITVSVPQP